MGSKVFGDLFSFVLFDLVLGSRSPGDGELGAEFFFKGAIKKNYREPEQEPEPEKIKTLKMAPGSRVFFEELGAGKKFIKTASRRLDRR